MGKKRDQLRDVRFRCEACESTFDLVPARIEDAPEDAWHPWRYYAACPLCGAELEQERRQRHLLKMWAHATGPKTADGIARVSENLKGHPTPEETVRTRFNALQHGMRAKVATYFPARPGKYPHCEGCEYRWSLCLDAVACLKRTELFLKHHIAFETRDPGLLGELNADLQANVRALIDDMIIAIIKDGARVEEVQWYFDPKGSMHIVEVTNELTGERRPITVIKAHPLLKVLAEYLSRNSMSLGDMGMTQKGTDEAETVRGHLAGQEARAESLLEYQQRQAKALEDLRGMIQRSREATKHDPVLLEHQAQEHEP